ncbi:hypothetical protein [Halobaculum sp. D14]|uniref:hypothetical protein n=1 Tax=unclassified Halobaculum TaxID=2640896 RepID=UPI003EB7D521
MASDGDIRVLIGIDLVLSAVFGAVALFAADYVGVASFTPRNLAVATVVIAALTYLVVLRE